MPHLTLSSQESLLQFFDGGDAAPAQPPTPPVMGKTFDKKVDGERLSSQQRRVEELMSDGEPRTLLQIAIALRKLYGAHFPEASISARLRDMRRAGYTIERSRKTPKSGLWIYTAVKAEVAL